MTPEKLAKQIAGYPRKGRRRLVALAGAPASGKSTLAAQIAARHAGWAVVPMDGFHLDNRLLEQRGLIRRKGAPETFDVAGLGHLVTRLATEEQVYYPLFDRATDVSLNAAGSIGPEVETVIIEGNYLLFDDPAWRGVANFWDVSIRLAVPQDVLKARLLRRWLDHGLDAQVAEAKVRANDMPNAALIDAHALPADIVVESPSNLA